jgi:CRP-like cAMP-binding protein
MVMDPVMIDWTGIEARRARHKKGGVVFSQGDASSTVHYIEQGTVRLSVVSDTGKAGVVAVVGAGHFIGEGCLAGQLRRVSTATAMSACTLVEVKEKELRRQMQARPLLADLFLSHMIVRNMRMEEDLIDQLFHDAEKRLARALLLMARDDDETQPLPRVSQAVLAEMVGTTRSRVSTFMNKFRKLGFIEYSGTLDLKVNDSLLSVLVSGAASRPLGATAAYVRSGVRGAGTERSVAAP